MTVVRSASATSKTVYTPTFSEQCRMRNASSGDHPDLTALATGGRRPARKIRGDNIFITLPTAVAAYRNRRTA